MKLIVRKKKHVKVRLRQTIKRMQGLVRAGNDESCSLGFFTETFLCKKISVSPFLLCYIPIVADVYQSPGAAVAWPHTRDNTDSIQRFHQRILHINPSNQQGFSKRNLDFLSFFFLPTL